MTLNTAIALIAVACLLVAVCSTTTTNAAAAGARGRAHRRPTMPAHKAAASETPSHKPSSSSSTSTSTSSSSEPFKVKAQQRTIAYIESWDQYSETLLNFTDDIASRLTHVNYAFATVTYAPDRDAWFVSPADPWADIGKCFEQSSCWAEHPQCIFLPGRCGSDSNVATTLVPFIGAENSTDCPTSCYNEGGAPSGRSPSCIASLAGFAHQWQLNWSTPAVPMACGLYHYYLNDVAKQPNAQHIQWLLSIGGWYDSNYFSAATTDKYRAGLVKSIVEYITAMGFDGVDIDWEYPAFEHGGEPMPNQPKSGDPEDTTDCTTDTCQRPERVDDPKNYVLFLQELRAAFTAKGNNPHKLPYLISIAAPAGINKFTKLDLQSMCASLDWVNLMAYDIHGAGENLTNHQAAIYDDTPGAVGPQNSISAAVEGYISAGCPPDKINVGVPFYGHLFLQTPAGNSSAPGLFQPHNGPSESVCQMDVDSCVPPYKVIRSQSGWTDYWDSKAQASFAYNTLSQQFVSFDNVQAIEAKRAYAAQKGLGGFMLWYLGGDDANNTLLKALNGG